MSKLYANIQCAASWVGEKDESKAWDMINSCVKKFWNMEGVNSDNHESALQSAIKNGIDPKLVDYYRLSKVA